MAHGYSTRRYRLPITPENYPREEDRLNSFFGWPLSGVNPKPLARSGLVYTGEGALVQCCQCGVKHHWSPGDNPLDACKRHCHSSSCPFTGTRPPLQAPHNDEQFYYHSDLKIHEVLPPIQIPVSPSSSDNSHVQVSNPTSSPPESLPIQETTGDTSYNIEFNIDQNSPKPCTETFGTSENSVCQDTSSMASKMVISTIPPACVWKGDYPPYLPSNRPSGQMVTGGPATSVLYNDRYISLTLEGEDASVFSQVADSSDRFHRTDERFVVAPQRYNDYYLCRICWEVVINTILLPCQHVALCVYCASRAKDETGRCPFCSQFIERIDIAVLI